MRAYILRDSDTVEVKNEGHNPSLILQFFSEIQERCDVSYLEKLNVFLVFCKDNNQALQLVDYIICN